MKIKINFHEKKKYIVSEIVIKNIAGDKANLSFHKEKEDKGYTILSHVCMNNIPIEKVKDTFYWSLDSITVKDENLNVLRWVEIDNIEIIKENETYYLYEALYSEFKRYRIEGVNHIFTRNEYYAAYRHVLDKNRKDNVINALDNLSEIPANVKNYLKNQVIEDLADEFEDKTAYTGEDEANAIDEYIKYNCGGIVYPLFISNKDTDNETCQTIPMLEIQLEKVKEMVREVSNGDSGPEYYGLEWPKLYDINNDVVSLEFVDEILEEEDYKIYKIHNNSPITEYLLANAPKEELEMVSQNCREAVALADELAEKGYFACLYNGEKNPEEERVEEEYYLINPVLAMCDIEISNVKGSYGVAVAKEDKEYVEKLMKEAYECWSSEDVKKCVLPNYTKERLEDTYYGDFLEQWLHHHNILFNEDIGIVKLEGYCFDEPAEGEACENISDWRDQRTTTYFFKKSALLKRFHNKFYLEKFKKNYTYDDVECELIEENIPYVFKYTSA